MNGRRGFTVGLVLLSAFWGGAGCAGSDEDDSGYCTDAPAVTYETFGDGFMTQNCRTCHTSGQTVRQGAPDDVNFDDAASVWALKDRVLARAAIDTPTMPPLGGTTEDDRYLLRAWLECGTDGE